MKVQCINAINSYSAGSKLDRLIKGAIYEVISETANQYSLMNVPGRFDKNRFSVVAEETTLTFPCQVKCVDNNSINMGSLELGKIYTATGYNYTGKDFILLESPGGIPSWKKERFVIVSVCALTNKTLHGFPAINKDEADKKEMMKFFSKVQPGECACGIIKKQCQYHR